MRELALFASLALGALALQKLKPKNEEEIEYAPEYFDEEKEEPAALVSGPCAEPVGKLSQRGPFVPNAAWFHSTTQFDAILIPPLLPFP